MPFIVPEVVPYLLAILALLLIWQVHNMLATAGHIEASDFWDRSGVRFFLHLTPVDDQTCQVCREANGTAVLTAVAAKRNFTPLHSPCKNPAGCRCQLVGLYGGWPEAIRLLQQLTVNPRPKSIKLTDDKLSALLRVPWQSAKNGNADRLSVQMLEAIRTEGTDSETAVKKYQTIVDQARAPRDIPLVIPAYLRMVDILERSERSGEALDLISRFEKRYAEDQGKGDRPTHAQRELLSLRKTRLTATAQRAF